MALLVSRATLLFRVATAFGAAAAVLAMVAFFPRSFPVLGIEALRDKYLRADERFTRLAVLAVEIELRERRRKLIRFKTWLVRSTIVALALAIALASLVLSCVEEDEAPMTDDRHPVPPSTDEAPPAPPFNPDPDLIDHMEGNRREIRIMKEAARHHAAEARRRYDEEMARRHAGR